MESNRLGQVTRSAYGREAFGRPLEGHQETPEVGRWSLLTLEPIVLTYGDVSYVSVSWRFAHVGVAQRSPHRRAPDH